MKRSDGGYVMIYALVIIAILSVTAMAVCGAAVSNLQSQRKQVARMQDRCAAEGVLEVLQLKLQQEIDSSEDILIQSSPDDPSAETAAAEKAQTYVQNMLGDYLSALDELTEFAELSQPEPSEDEDGTYTFTVSVTAGEITVQAEYEIRLCYSAERQPAEKPESEEPQPEEQQEPETEPPAEPAEKTTYTVTVRVDSIRCLSYEIVSAEGGGEA